MYFWWLIKNGWNLKNNLKILLGFIVGSISILLPFFVISGDNILKNNYILNSFLRNTEGNNKLFTFITGMGEVFGNKAELIFINTIVIGFISLFSIAAKNHCLNNPFWNISFASLLAFTVSFIPVFSADYILSLVIPLFYAIAFTPTLSLKEFK